VAHGDELGGAAVSAAVATIQTHYEDMAKKK
jgi:hypothetical protein